MTLQQDEKSEATKAVRDHAGKKLKEAGLDMHKDGVGAAMPLSLWAAGEGQECHRCVQGSPGSRSSDFNRAIKDNWVAGVVGNVLSGRLLHAGRLLQVRDKVRRRRAGSHPVGERDQRAVHALPPGPADVYPLGVAVEPQ
eukprot:2370061-Pyramimonas_sp.AAC.1